MPLFLYPSVATPVEYQPVTVAEPIDEADQRFLGGIFRPRPPATPVPPIGELPPPVFPPITPVPPIGQLPPVVCPPITPVPPIGDLRPPCPCWAVFVPEMTQFCDPTRPCTWLGMNLPPGPPLVRPPVMPAPPITPVPPIGQLPCPWCRPCNNCGAPITPVPPIGSLRSSCSSCCSSCSSSCSKSSRRTNCCCQR